MRRCVAVAAAAQTELHNWFIPRGPDDGGEVNSAGPAARLCSSVADQLAASRHFFHRV